MSSVSIIGLVFSGIMLLLSIVNLIISRIRDLKNDTATSTTTIAELEKGIMKANLKLDTVCNTTQDIKTDIKAMDNKLTEHSEKIAVLSRDLETAFIRIDELRENKEDKK